MFIKFQKNLILFPRGKENNHRNLLTHELQMLILPLSEYNYRGLATTP